MRVLGGKRALSSSVLRCSCQIPVVETIECLLKGHCVERDAELLAECLLHLHPHIAEPLQQPARRIASRSGACGQAAYSSASSSSFRKRSTKRTAYPSCPRSCANRVYPLLAYSDRLCIWWKYEPRMVPIV